MFSWYKYLIVILDFSHLGFWSGNLFLIAPFPDRCLFVPFCSACGTNFIPKHPLNHKNLTISSMLQLENAFSHSNTRETGLWETGEPVYENSCSFGLRYVFMVKVPDCKFGFFPPRFLEWESFSDCAFS